LTIINSAFTLRLKGNPGQLWLLAAILMTLVIYLPLWNNGFVNWDDNVYVLENPLIFNSWTSSFVNIFSSSFEGHYHPLTLLSLKLDFSLFGLNPRAFHSHNLLLHLLNTILVFRVFMLITKKPMLAGITAVLFGIHPMHVESVAWASARKDVLFTFWFLLAFILWLKYLDDRKKKYILLSMLAFLLSVLSKGQAVFLPLCLILTEVYLGKSLFSWKIWLEKIPFFVIALALGIVAIYVQEKTGYTSKNGLAPGFLEMLLVAGTAFCLYLMKIIVPINLSAYYSYPAFHAGIYPPAMWLGLLIFLILLAAMFYFYRKNKTVFFGLMFFLLNIFIFLKWIPVSNYIIADRYTYIAALGLFFMAAVSLDNLRKYGKLQAISAYAILAVLLLSYGLSAATRVPVWKDTSSLMDNILKNNPDVYSALNARGSLRLEQGDFKGAMDDYSHAINVQPKTARAYANRAELLIKANRSKEALHDFDQALDLEPDNPRYHNNRGLNRIKEGMIPQALDDFTAATHLAPGIGIYYANRGKALNLLGRFDQALAELQKAASLGARLPFMAFETGIAYYNLKDFNRAVLQFNQALQQDLTFVDAYFYRGFSNYNLGDFVSAESDLTTALNKQDNNPLAWAMRGLARIRLGNKDGACNDFYKAKELGLKQVDQEIEKNCR